MLKKSIKPVLGIILFLIVGTFGFHFIKIIYSDGPVNTTILDSLYFAVITLTTVGYGDNLELLNLGEPGHSVGIVFTVLYILIGYGFVLWAFSQLVTNLVEITISGKRREKEMLKKISNLTNHYILCGIGRTGITIIDEFIKTKNPFVIINNEQEDIEEIISLYPENEILYIKGDPTEEIELQKAQIEKAKGLICNLPTDKDNVFLALTARPLNSSLLIVTHALDKKSRTKLLMAGANNVVYPEQIGAFRMVSEVLRPTVVTFLDKMLKISGGTRFTEIFLSEKSKYAGKKISESNIHNETGLLVVAIYNPESNEFTYNPGPDDMLAAGNTLVVIGDNDQVGKLSSLANP